jgi:hypothetical protein
LAQTKQSGVIKIGSFTYYKYPKKLQFYYELQSPTCSSFTPIEGSSYLVGHNKCEMDWMWDFEAYATPPHHPTLHPMSAID